MPETKAQQEKRIIKNIFSLGKKELTATYENELGEQFTCKFIKLNEFSKRKAQQALREQQKKSIDVFRTETLKLFLDGFELIKQNSNDEQGNHDSIKFKENIFKIIEPLYKEVYKILTKMVHLLQNEKPKISPENSKTQEEIDKEYNEKIDKGVENNYKNELELLETTTGDGLINLWSNLLIQQENKRVEYEYMLKVLLMEAVYDKEDNKIFTTLDEFDKLNDEGLINWMIKKYLELMPIQTQEDIKEVAKDNSFRDNISDSKGLPEITIS